MEKLSDEDILEEEIIQEEEDLKWFIEHTPSNNPETQCSGGVVCEVNHIDTDKMPANNTWVIDTGCTNHMTKEKSKLSSPKKSDINVVTALNEIKQGDHYIGHVHMNCQVEDEIRPVLLNNVLNVQKLRRNLISVSQICERDP